MSIKSSVGKSKFGSVFKNWKLGIEVWYFALIYKTSCILIKTYVAAS